MYVHSVPDGEEVFVVSLRGARIDHKPQIARLLKRSGDQNGHQSSQSLHNGASSGLSMFGGSGMNGNGAGGSGGGRVASDEDRVFAVYSTDNTWLFKARSEREKVDWIFRIDQSYFGGGGSGGSGSGDEED